MNTNKPIALITGASSGIGQATALRLAKAGYQVYGTSRRGAQSGSQSFEMLALDVTRDESVHAAVAELMRLEGRIDLLVNNAGFGTSGSFHELDADRLDAEIQLNIAALTRLSRAAMGVMIPRGRGFLLNVSSVASFQPAPKLAVYAATKAYVTNLTESLHEEARGTGVHVTALCPGLTRTEFQSVSSTESYATQYPTFVWLEAHEVALAGLNDVAKGKALSVPGVLYKGMVTASGLTPRGLARRLSSLVQRD